MYRQIVFRQWSLFMYMLYMAQHIEDGCQEMTQTVAVWTDTKNVWITCGRLLWGNILEYSVCSQLNKSINNFLKATYVIIQGHLRLKISNLRHKVKDND